MDNLDTRWKQRFANFKKAFAQFERFTAKGEKLSELEEQGLIKCFEYTYELGWNALKDYLEYQGYTNLTGSRDTIRQAFSSGLIQDGMQWMDMLQSRNKTSHTYNEETAKEIVEAILKRYHRLFTELKLTMEKLETQS